MPPTLTGQKQILIGVLAKIDAIFQPWRKWEFAATSRVHTLRREYLAGEGVRWRSFRRTEAGRKDHERDMAELKEAGLIVVESSAPGPTTRVMLTDLGEETARRLATASSLDAGLATMVEIARLLPEHGFGEWLPETVLSRVEYGTPAAKEQLTITEVLASSALSRGWVRSNSDTHNRVFYAIEPAGREVLANTPVPAIECSVEAGTSTEAKFYARRFRIERAALEVPPQNVPRDIGECPLTCSMGKPNSQRQVTA